MKKKGLKPIVAGTILALSLSVMGCGEATNTIENTNQIQSGAGQVDANSAEVEVVEGSFSSADLNYDYSSESVTEVNLATLTQNFTIASAGYYRFIGASSNYSIIVDANSEDKVHIILDDVSMTHENFAPIYVKNANKVFVIIEGDNTLTTSGSFVQIDDNTVDGVLFSKEDLTIQGDGKLTINSNNAKHGIVCKDDLRITSGEVVVNAKNHAIDANDSVSITGEDTVINLTSKKKDGIHCENEDDTTKGYVYIEEARVTINATAGDGIDASKSVYIASGNINITAGGGSVNSAGDDSTKGIKADQDILISNGNIVVNSADDCVHSNGSIQLAGGEMSLSSGDDGVHADTSLTISAGKVYIQKSYEGLEAQNLTISGGEISVIADDDGINAAGGNDGSSHMVPGGAGGFRPGRNNFNTASNAFIKITGGDIYINAKGDGIDSNGNLYVSGGSIVVDGPIDNGNGPLDYDGTGAITGGNVVAVGSSGMAQNFSSAGQGSVLCQFTSTKSAGTTFKVTDTSGNVVLEHQASKACQSVVFSSASFTKGNTYYIYANDIKIGQVTFNNYITSVRI